ncbi:MAG: 50S ribosomal protein L35 [Verrucomicrobiales bacterium]
MPQKSGASKTRKSVSKRFKITGTGKILRRKQGRRHLLVNKSAKRKRRLAQAGLVAAVDVPRIRRCMPFA